MSAPFGVRNIPIPVGGEAPNRPATWQDATTRYDMVGAALGYVADQAELDAITDPVVGMLVYRWDDEITYRYNGSAWKAWESGWIAIAAPTVTNFNIGTLGNASSTHFYRYQNGRVTQRGVMILGTSGQSVPGAVSVGLQVAGAALPAGATAIPVSGNVYAIDTGAALYVGSALRTTSVVQFWAQNSGQLTSQYATAVPFAFGAGDMAGYEITYDPA